jgi:hypothetical protein
LRALPFGANICNGLFFPRSCVPQLFGHENLPRSASRSSIQNALIWAKRAALPFATADAVALGGRVKPGHDEIEKYEVSFYADVVELDELDEPVSKLSASE